ncbi:PD-(D/E)XK nuclease-like domain-containing protein [Arenimonas sp.]|uniref:PD-(D/E)XK nuclease-like domain-containing protein n=1 Tax=Arenimonas sp. TaxID=1872635 RepID=UPI0039E4D434
MNAVLKYPEPALGLTYGEPADVYHVRRLGELSCSGIKELLRSPQHYQHWATQPDDESTDAMLFGRAFHMALLEPERFARTYRVLPEDAPRKPSSAQRNAKKPSDDTVAAIQWWDAFERAGLLVLKPDDAERIRAMVASVQAHPWAKLLTQGGQAEVSLRWIDEATGLPCKARADYFVDGPKRFALDVKSCVDASPAGFGRAVANYTYDLQHAHYCDGFRANGLPLDNYILLAIENEAPYVCQPYFLDAESEQRGYSLRARGAEILKRCLDAGRFPGYSDDILRLSMPAWAFKSTQE